MEEKRVKKGSKDRKESIPKAAPDAKSHEKEQEGKFDFGGLPDRDLKKNLGCG
jgi:hypothetical protein